MKVRDGAVLTAGAAVVTTTAMLAGTATPAAAWSVHPIETMTCVPYGDAQWGAWINDNATEPFVDMDHNCEGSGVRFHTKVKWGWAGTTGYVLGDLDTPRPRVRHRMNTFYPTATINGVCFGVKPPNDNWNVRFIGRGSTRSEPGCPPAAMGDFFSPVGP